MSQMFTGHNRMVTQNNCPRDISITLKANLSIHTNCIVFEFLQTLLRNTPLLHVESGSKRKMRENVWGDCCSIIKYSKTTPVMFAQGTQSTRLHILQLCWRAMLHIRKITPKCQI